MVPQTPSALSIVQRAPNSLRTNVELAILPASNAILLILVSALSVDLASLSKMTGLASVRKASSLKPTLFLARFVILAAKLAKMERVFVNRVSLGFPLANTKTVFVLIRLSIMDEVVSARTSTKTELASHVAMGSWTKMNNAMMVMTWEEMGARLIVKFKGFSGAVTSHYLVFAFLLSISM